MRGQRFEQQREAVFQAEVFAVAGGVLADEGDFLHAAGDELLGFCDHGFEAARAEFAAQIGNDAEGAGMIAAFGDLDVCGGAASGDEARRVFVVKIGGQHVRRAMPFVAAEAALFLAEIAFGTETRAAPSYEFLLHCFAGLSRVFWPGRILLRAEDVEGRWSCGDCEVHPGGFQNGLEFAGADDCVDFGDVLA